MDKLVSYRQNIKALLSRYTEGKQPDEQFEAQLLLDEVRDHYLWLDVGWDGSRRIYHPMMHFDIKQGKIWLQENMTDIDPAVDLIKLGVLREDIVLGLHPPYKRQFTDYGVA
ncbi:MAG: XisI protein [Spirulina sp. SIO3F2]|nr:XisI protein [Spirulina sp. SIO3F2]